MSISALTHQQVAPFDNDKIMDVPIDWKMSLVFVTTYEEPEHSFHDGEEDDNQHSHHGKCEDLYVRKG
jgi:hypothetical protein